MVGPEWTTKADPDCPGSWGPSLREAPRSHKVGVGSNQERICASAAVCMKFGDGLLGPPAILLHVLALDFVNEAGSFKTVMRSQILAHHQKVFLKLQRGLL